MKKITIKIICFLFVFVFCVPLGLCVSAETIIYPDSLDVSSYGFDDLLTFFSSSDKRKSQVVSGHDTISEQKAEDLKFPYKYILYDDKYYKFDLSDYEDMIKYFFVEYSNNLILTSSEKFYYYCYISKISDEKYSLVLYCSSSFIYFKTTDNIKYYAISDSPLNYSSFSISKSSGGGVDTSFSYDYDDTSPYTSTSFGWYYKNTDTSYLQPSSFLDFWTANKFEYKADVFIVPFKIDGFPNFLENATHDGVNFFGPLSLQIDVKLTPEFGYDMDRVFDKNTGQNDYFKFEITNNSDKAIQWSACIYDPSLITSDSFFLDGFSNWKYMCRESYYASSVDEDKGIFRTTWTYDGVLNVGSFDYHLLNPGETFSDIIYWENIKINANKIYTFNVNAFYTDLKYPTMVINPAVTGETSDLHSVVKCTDDYYKTILHYNGSEFGYRSFESSVFSCEFSVLNIPDFTTVKKGGNSVVNTSGNDAYNQQANYETQSNLNGTDTKINKDYVDPTILANLNNRLNVDVDLDNFSIDDVKDYITSCQSFFALIKEALLSFPAFVWALICFGLTGLIVIGIVKALL